jgi:small-conductance mechanosensitive channel
MKMRKAGLLWSLVVLVCLAVAGAGGIGLVAPALAQQTPAITAGQVTAGQTSGNISADQARQTLDVLQNDTKRNQLIQVLQTIANAPTGVAPTGAIPAGTVPASSTSTGATTTGTAPASTTPAGTTATGATPTGTTVSPNAAAPATTSAKTLPTAAAPGTPAALPSETVLQVPLPADSLGAQLLEQGSAWLDDAATTIAETVKNVADLPRIWTWLILSISDPMARAQLFNAIWRLAAVIGCAVVAEYCLRFLMKKPLYLIERRAAYLRGLAGLGGDTATTSSELAADETPPSDPAETTPSDIDPGSDPTTPEVAAIVARDASGLPKKTARGWLWMRRIPWAILHFLLCLLPVVIFAVVGNSLLGTTLGDPKSVRLAGIAAVNAWVLVRGITYVVQLIVMSQAPGLRLLPISDSSAAYIEIWTFRIFGTALFGTAISEMALLLGLSRAGHDTLMKIVFFIVAVCAVIIILQSRHNVSYWLRARPGRNGPVAVALNRLAAIWYIFAIFLVLALWLVWAMEIRHGFEKLAHFTLLFLGILIVARLTTLLLHAVFDRLFRIDQELEKRFPGLTQRANRYYPILRGAISLVVATAGIIALLQVWGLDAFDWFHGDEIGSRLLSAIITVAISGLIAVGVWEGSNLAMDRHMMRLDRTGDYLHAARLRTLVPIMKTVLFCIVLVVVVLTILSQIGVNIAPLLAGASIIGVAIGFGSQKLVQDFITGIFLLLENAMQVGDSITASGLSGTVEKLSIRTIRLRAGDGAVHIIPFSSVGTVTNINRGVGNAAVKVSVAAGEDYDKVGETLKAIAKEMRGDDNYRHMMRSDLQLWGVDEVQAGVMTIAGQIVCSDTGRWGVQREFNRRLLKRFTELGIKLANPSQYVVLAQAGTAAEAEEVEAENALEIAANGAGVKTGPGAVTGPRAVTGAGTVAKPGAATGTPGKQDSVTSVRNSPPPTALGHTE